MTMMIFLFTIMLIALATVHLMSYKASEKLREHAKEVLDCAQDIQDNNEKIIKLNKLLIKELTKQNNIKLTTDDNEEGIDKLINEL